MGNSNGALHKYTELADQKNCGYQGGFIWDYIDQSIWKKDRYGKWFQAYGGDFGERPTDYNSVSYTHLDVYKRQCHGRFHQGGGNEVGRNRRAALRKLVSSVYLEDRKSVV